MLTHQELERAYKSGQDAYFRSSAECKAVANPYRDEVLATAWYRGFSGEPIQKLDR